MFFLLCILLFPSALTFAVPLNLPTNPSLSLNSQHTSLNTSLTMVNALQLTSLQLTRILTVRIQYVQRDRISRSGATLNSVFAGPGCASKYNPHIFRNFEIIHRSNSDGKTLVDKGEMEPDGSVSWPISPSLSQEPLPHKQPLPWPPNPRMGFFDVQRILDACQYSCRGLEYHMDGPKGIPTSPDPPPQFPVYQALAGLKWGITISAETGDVMTFGAADENTNRQY